jgi:hypothetical protein
LQSKIVPITQKTAGRSQLIHLERALPVTRERAKVSYKSARPLKRTIIVSPEADAFLEEIK